MGTRRYAPALQVTQSFPVGGQGATQVSLTLDNKTPAASATTNVTITVTLENSVGVQVDSSGTTTVVLSDIGNGFFSLSKGAAGSSALDVTFISGASTATAYFGDENAGADTISAEYGTTDWGSAAVTVQGAVSSASSHHAEPLVARSVITYQHLVFVPARRQMGQSRNEHRDHHIDVERLGQWVLRDLQRSDRHADAEHHVRERRRDRDRLLWKHDIGLRHDYGAERSEWLGVIYRVTGGGLWGITHFKSANSAEEHLNEYHRHNSIARSYGNHVTTSGVSLGLSDNSDNSGFFATTVGTKGGAADLGTHLERLGRRD